MERETFYLDNDEEITSVVDKLKNAETAYLDLVVPKEALLLQSVVNLKLLKRQAEGLGKEITIVTQDKVGKKLAEQIGIPVVERVGEVPKEVKMSEADSLITENDIEFKEVPKEKKIKESPVEDDGIEIKPQDDGVMVQTSEKVAPTAAALEANEAPSPLPLERQTKAKGKRWKKYGLLSGFGVLALAVLAYIFVPLANVNLQVAAVKEKVDFTFTADKNATEVKIDSQAIPAREITAEIEKAEKFPATGKKKVGTRATGTITVTNKQYTSDFSLVAGTRFASSNGLIFKTTANVTVPKYEQPFGQPLKPGTASVSVEAENYGDQYNVAASHFTLPSLNSSNVYGDSAAAMSGGSSKDVIFVTQADVNGAKDTLTKNLQDELKEKVSGDLHDNEQVVEGSLKMSDVVAEPSVAVNAEASEFELKVKTNVKGLAFKESDLKKLAEGLLGDKIGPAKEIVESGSLLSATEHIATDIEKGEMTAKVSGEAYIATKIEEDKIKDTISGDSEAKVLEYLKTLDGVDNIELKFFPRFYKRIPRIESHIYIKTNINKEQPQTSQEEESQR